MNKISAILLCLISISAFTQTQYEINGFSELYKGTLIIEKGYENEVFKKGQISIIEIKTHKPVITIDSEELTFDFDKDGNVKTNALELPYGEQNVIICKDFNFDGIKDLAIMDGQFSCYHGPSYQIYLQTRKGLQQSSEFTELAQNYCGMFQVNYETKTIHTMTKSGCCRYQYSEFKVLDNIPIEKKVVEKGLNANGILWNYTERNNVNNKMVETKYSILSDDADINLVYAMTFKNEKQMNVYRAFAFEDYLFYVFSDENKRVELFYNGDFIYDKRKNTLTFTNQDIEYQVYDKGILVNIPNKKVDMKAARISEDGTLSSLETLKLKNLTIK